MAEVQDNHERRETLSGQIRTRTDKANRRDMQSIRQVSSRPSRSSDGRWSRGHHGCVVVGQESCCSRGTISGLTRSSCIQLVNGEFNGTVRYIRVENPILDTAVVIGSRISGGLERVNDFRLPVVLDQIFEIFTISGRWIWDIVVREPSLKLSFVPFIVRCDGN